MMGRSKIGFLHAATACLAAGAAALIGRRPVGEDRRDTANGVLVQGGPIRGERFPSHRADLFILDDLEPVNKVVPPLNGAFLPNGPWRWLPSYYSMRPKWEQRVILAAFLKRDRRSAKWAALIAAGKVR